MSQSVETLDGNRDLLTAVNKHQETGKQESAAGHNKDIHNNALQDILGTVA